MIHVPNDEQSEHRRSDRVYARHADVERQEKRHQTARNGGNQQHRDKKDNKASHKERPK